MLQIQTLSAIFSVIFTWKFLFVHAQRLLSPPRPQKNQFNFDTDVKNGFRVHRGFSHCGDPDVNLNIYISYSRFHCLRQMLGKR